MNLDPYIRHGWTFAEMAPKVGVTPERVRQICAKQGVTGATLRATRRQRLRARFDPRQTVEANAKRLGVGTTQLRAITKDLRKRRKPPRFRYPTR